MSNKNVKKEYSPFSLNQLENKNDNDLVLDICMNLYNKFLIDGKLELSKRLAAAINPIK